jgi:transcriptional regulator with XRE-family HTH domain
MLMTVEEIVKALHRRSGSEVARGSGVHFVTISRIKKGHKKAPSYGTLEKLTRYFQEHPVEEEILEREVAALREKLGEGE